MTDTTADAVAQGIEESLHRWFDMSSLDTAEIQEVVDDIRAAMPTPLEDVLLKTLVDDLPGHAVSIAHSDGQWHVAQEYCGLGESFPTGVVGVGDTIRDAVRNATEGADGEA